MNSKFKHAKERKKDYEIITIKHISNYSNGNDSSKKYISKWIF